MAAIDDLQAKVDGLGVALDGVQQLVIAETEQVAGDLQVLRDQIAALTAGAVTPEQLDALAASADAAALKVAGLGDSVAMIDPDGPAPES